MRKEKANKTFFFPLHSWHTPSSLPSIFWPNGHCFPQVRALNSRARPDEHACGHCSRDKGLDLEKIVSKMFGTMEAYFLAIFAITGEDSLQGRLRLTLHHLTNDFPPSMLTTKLGW
ncbi:hypothetical protein JCGZ_25456 [Jatropha curcas]|uniref:Uncharacterized protein n=1 Tax=Jatropha curcas TaxID=180498 RepID=A0A067L4G4_JATCU|nr:hypothetical protein JCGZ_25456 [Jatropha curcas]